MARTASEALNGARELAYKEEGATTLLCVWHGGYSFNVYDENWQEVHHFTSGTAPLATGDGSDETRAEAAREQMEERGYTPVN